MAKKLQESTEEKMKIEVAPWIKDYVTEMDDLYTDLTMEKINNKSIGGRDSKIYDYKDFFAEQKDKKRKTLPCRNPEEDSDGERILLKGDPGMGKPQSVRRRPMIGPREFSRHFQLYFLFF